MATPATNHLFGVLDGRGVEGDTGARMHSPATIHQLECCRAYLLCVTRSGHSEILVVQSWFPGSIAPIPRTPLMGPWTRSCRNPAGSPGRGSPWSRRKFAHACNPSSRTWSGPYCGTAEGSPEYFLGWPDAIYTVLVYLVTRAPAELWSTFACMSTTMGAGDAAQM